MAQNKIYAPGNDSTAKLIKYYPNPAVTYIDEVGNAVIRGVIISNQHYSLIHNVIYEIEFITELIEELKIALPDAI